MVAFFDEEGRRLPPDGSAFGPTHFDRASYPIRGYYFPDDPISPPDNVPPMLSLYDQAEIETRRVTPSELNVSGIGHLGFFKSDVGVPPWNEPLGWLEQQA